LSAIAAMCGVNRLALYRLLWTGRVGDDMVELLTPWSGNIRGRKLGFRRTSPRSDESNRWQMIDT
jgi:hypothetical protein